MPWLFNPITEEIDYYDFAPDEYVAKNTASVTENLSWSSYSDMPTARRTPAAAADSNGNIYVAGGVGHETTFEIYDKSSSSWSSGTAVPNGVLVAAGVCDSSGNFHLIGGQDSGGTVHNYHQVWNGSSWTTSGTLNTARATAAIAIDDNDNIYVSHGYNSSGDLASLEKWSPTTSSFSTEASAAHIREYVAGDILNGKFYVFCGYGGGQVRYIEEYSISGNTWSDVTPSSGPPTARNGLLAVTLDDGKIHLLYGNISTSQNLHEPWDGTTCETLTSATVPPIRGYTGIGGQTQESTKKAYVVGGKNGGSDIADCDILVFSSSGTECYPLVKTADCTAS